MAKNDATIAPKETYAGKFGTIECPACHKQISAGGAARTSHFRSHVKDGSMDETKDAKGKLQFTPTGESPVSKVERATKAMEQTKTVSRFASNAPTRKPVKVEVTKAGVLIFCRGCGKKNHAKDCSVDERFVRTQCDCGKLTLFQKRFTTKMGTVTA